MRDANHLRVVVHCREGIKNLPPSPQWQKNDTSTECGITSTGHAYRDISVLQPLARESDKNNDDTGTAKIINNFVASLFEDCGNKKTSHVYF